MARQVAFFRPADDMGKWHAAWSVDHTPVCGARVTLAREAIRPAAGRESVDVHPIVCRRCLRLSTVPGVTAAGMVR